MSNTSNKKIKSFFRELGAILKGDSEGISKEKSYREITSALNIRIHQLKGNTMQFEQELESAEEKLHLALYNGGKRFSSLDPDASRKGYIDNLILARNAKVTAERNLRDHKLELLFLEESLEQMDEEVDDTFDE